MKPAQLRYALAQRLGEQITPEVAAWIEAVAISNPLPMPDIAAQRDGLDISQDQRLFDFINQQIGSGYCPTSERAIGVSNAHGVKGVVIFTNRRQHSVEMAVAGAGRWLSRALLHWIFHYAFVQVGVGRVTAIVRGDNARALSFNEHVGFQQEGLLRGAYGDQDMVVMGMLRPECHWIRGV